MKCLRGLARSKPPEVAADMRSAEMADVEASLAEVMDFDAVLESIGNCGQQLLDTIPRVQGAPSEMLALLRAAFSGESAGGQLVAQLSSQLSACLHHMAIGMPHLEGMMQVVKEARSQIADTKASMEACEAAWAVKVHCEAKTKLLRKSGGRKLTIKEKSACLKARSDADEEFARVSDDARRLINEVLYSRWSNTTAALAGLCDCYTQIFEAPSKFTGDLTKSVAQLPSVASPPVTSVSGVPFHSCAEETTVSGAPYHNFADETNDTGDDYLPALPPDDEEKTCLTESPSQSPPTFGANDSREDRPSVFMPDTPGSGASTRRSSAEARTSSSPRWPGAEAPAGIRHGQPPLPPPQEPPSGHSDLGTSFESIPAQVRYAKGDNVKIWSKTKEMWLDGVVEEVFAEGGTYDSYNIPPGVIKVGFGTGMKFVMPENQDAVLQKVGAGPAVTSWC